MDYELIYIISSKFSEKEAEGKFEEIREILKKNKVLILKEDHWGKKKLAYPIKKNSQGYYNLIEFSSGSDQIKNIDKQLKLNEDIIRFLIVKKEVVKKQPKSLFKRESKKTVKKEKIIKKEEIEPEKIDKKIDKILEEDITNQV